MKNSTKFIFSLMVLVLIVIWAEIVRGPDSPNDVRLSFFNVGQGDSIMISKGDYQLLIDGGPDDSLLPEIGRVMPVSDREIEVIVLTHPHADHLVGLNQIVDRYKVGAIYLSGVIHNSNQYLEFLSKIKDNQISTFVPDEGQQINLFNNASISFLWPGKKFEKVSSCDPSDRPETEVALDCIKNLNNSSQVLKFCYFEQCSLYLGDLENDAQLEMLGNDGQRDYSAQILKISHHGSSNGSNQQFLDLVKPKFAVVSVGADNRYGHPHAATISLLESIKLPDGSTPKILRTDRDGTIGFVLSPTATTIINK